MARYLHWAVRMPCHAATVSSVRRLLDQALTDIGVAADCRADIALAVTEACANAVEHAQLGEEYDVVVIVDSDQCVAEVIDYGAGMELGRLDGVMVPATTERGRGLPLIRACTDGVELRRVHPHGLAVRMIKVLSWVPEAPTAWAAGGHDAWAMLHT
jgi:serine/threonine-protein kinase RsbW